MIPMTKREAERIGLVSKRNKFNAERDGKFDSQKEAKRYGELRLLERAGEIYNFEPHPRYPLKLAEINDGVLRWEILGHYEADFSYNISDSEGGWIVEDCKAYDKKTGKFLMTPLSRWKIKHFEVQYKVKVRIV